MAIKPPTKPVDGDEVDISFFTDMYDENETYLNKAINVGTDFVIDHTTAHPIVKTRHIYKPDFYESASRRTEAVSSETYYRQVPFGVENLSFHHPHAGSKTVDSETAKNAESGWAPVRNMGATFTVEESGTPSTILCSFYAYEMGGALSPWKVRRKVVCRVCPVCRRDKNRGDRTLSVCLYVVAAHACAKTVLVHCKPHAFSRSPPCGCHVLGSFLSCIAPTYSRWRVRTAAKWS